MTGCPQELQWDPVFVDYQINNYFKLLVHQFIFTFEEGSYVLRLTSRTQLRSRDGRNFLRFSNEPLFLVS